MNAIDRIALGYKWKQVAEPLIVKGDVTDADLQRCSELGQTMAAGLALGNFLRRAVVRRQSLSLLHCGSNRSVHIPVPLFVRTLIMVRDGIADNFRCTQATASGIDDHARNFNKFITLIALTSTTNTPSPAACDTNESGGRLSFQGELDATSHQERQ